MIDWTLFDAALRRSDRRADLLASIRRAEAWLARPDPASLADYESAVATPDAARATYRALLLVRWRLMHELGLDLSPASVATLAERLAACEQQTAAAPERVDCERVRRATFAAAVTAVLVAAHPDVVIDTPSPAAQEAHDALIALGARAAPAVEACGLGAVTPDRLAALDAVLGEFDALAARIPPGDEFRPNLDHSRGHIALALGGGAALLGRATAALAWYGRAAEAFAAAAEPDHAADARARAAALRARVAADLDADAAQALGAVLASAADPLDRAADLAALARQNCAAGDYFEAARAAADATAALSDAGVADPEVAGADAAVAALIAAAAREGGNAFLQRCTTGVATWSGIAQARIAARRGDAADAARAEEMLAAVHAIGEEMTGRARASAAALDAELTPYGLAGAAPDAGAASEGWKWQQAVAAYDGRVQAALDACWALAPDAPCDDLAAEAAALATAGAGMPSAQRARGALLTANVKLQQGDADACRAALDDAATLVLEGRPPVPESFAGAYERQIYLDAQWTRMKAAGGEDPAGALAACVAAVSLVEALRAHVGDPYQQSAFFAATTWAYDYGVGIARRLGDWDTMLALMDAAKARGVLRRAPPPDAVTLERWREIDAESDATRRERRWSLETIARARAAAAPPTPTVAAVQGALAADEVVLAYYWITADLLVVAAIDAAGIDVARVAPTADDVQQLTDFTALLAGGRTNRNFSGFFDALGGRLMPDACRARMRGKRRLVVSPHRALHLFPFHAVDWDGAPLVETFAVRYVPNLGALLLDWTGPAGGAVLSVGCGTFDGPNAPPALADTEPEARDVGAAYAAQGRPVTVLTGGDASRARLAALAAALPDVATVHLATHAVSVLAPGAADDPLSTRVYLRDGSLDGIGVAALGLRAELVVLAACNSGQRAIAGRGLTELPGDDVFGIQAVLFASGVRCVLGALWPVASAAARPIMVHLHEALAAGDPPDVALQRALRAHRAGDPRLRNLAYWAPYYLVELGRLAPSAATPDA